MVNESTQIFRAGDAPFTLPVEIGTTVILTGAKNAGKTTTLISWIDVWRAQGFALSGVYTKAVFLNGRHAGYDLIELPSEKSHPLIRKIPYAQSWEMGEFFFDADGFEALNASLRRIPAADLLILDEIGPLEIKRRSGLIPALAAFLDSRIPLLLVIRETYLDAYLDALRSLLS